MPRIFDNIDSKLLPALRETIVLSNSADFCVGYFNLRGWKELDSYIESWSGGKDNCCRLLIGMQRMPQEEIQTLLGLMKEEQADQTTINRIKKELVDSFKRQLAIGSPSDKDEAGLRRLAAQIKAKKVIVKLFLRHPLHAKLYMLFRKDPINPIVGYLGSSNLTLAGLSNQGELNIDVLDNDACKKLAEWFKDRWDDKWCIEISDDLVKVIEQSWAGEDLIPPYHIYIKTAYHLSREAREGIDEFRLPVELKKKLLNFQEAAVKIAAHHLNKRGGVLIGDVVGLGKTLMATALARIFEDDFDHETLIICPKNLVKMWEKDYREKYHLRGKVLSLSLVTRELPNLRRYRLVIIDESHNLRNREGRRFREIQEYIRKNDSKCLMLSATPYNKTYLDLSNQLRLFLHEEQELPIRPERLLNKFGETEFMRRHQCSTRSLAAFEKSEEADDWRELMRLFLVRRTRGFIIENYAETDPENNRKFIRLDGDKKFYFPIREPKKVAFEVDEENDDDQYARLFADEVVDSIGSLYLPRYGLGNYIVESPAVPPDAEEKKILENLARAGKRLKGFCRTNLFKRLESSGHSFLLSIERHILRNHVYLYAIENGKPLPIGTQDSGLLDTRLNDEDSVIDKELLDESENEIEEETEDLTDLGISSIIEKRAAEAYQRYETHGRKRFKWLRPDLFNETLAKHLREDAESLREILENNVDWDPTGDAKLNALHALLVQEHPDDKILVFSQFADTVRYLNEEMESRGVTRIKGVTGDSSDPTGIAWRFSPESNEKREIIPPDKELRVVIATDVLSEGQNLQDCFIVVNYDLPWAIIRLIQRVGRVDRIGQKSEKIIAYTFLPADGVESIIRLRARVRKRLQENAEVVGADEAFFEDEMSEQTIRDLFTEKSGILDGETDTEVDLASYAYQIWKNAVTSNPKLEKTITELQPVVYSTKPHEPSSTSPEGVIVYLRTAEDNDALVWMDRNGKVVTESQKTILDALKCSPETPALQRLDAHHELVRKGVDQVLKEEKSAGGQLGRPSGARFRTYERLKQYAEEVKGSLFDIQELHRAAEEIYKFPLRESAKDALNRLLRAHASNEDIARKVLELRDAGALTIMSEQIEMREPLIICSMGLSAGKEEKEE